MIRLGTLLAGLAAIGCSAAPPGLPVPAEVVEWRPFYWARVRTTDKVFEHAAIMVSDTGRRTAPGALLQLDLAGSGTMPNGYPDAAAHGVATNRATLHGLLTGVQPIEAVGRDTIIAPLTQVGTYGVPRFEYDVLLIDLAGRRIGTMPSTREVPTALWPPDRTVPVRWDGSRVTLSITFADGPTLAVLFDTGLSPFPLWVREDRWRELTGAGARVTRYVIPHPAGELRFVGARTRDPVMIGGVSLGYVEAVYLEQGPDAAHPERWPFPMDGVLGPSAFGQSGVMVLDIRHRRLSLPGR